MRFSFAALVLVCASSGCTCGQVSEEPNAPPDAAPTSTTPTTSALATPTPTPVEPESPPPTGLAFNAKIDWQRLDAGLRRAKAEHKPVCLVFYTEWCPHCRAYSHVFDDPRVIESARTFVMIRVDADAEPDANKAYALDGKYIPRTFFLSSDGAIESTIHAARPKFKFFFDENDAAPLLAAMSEAKQKLAKL